MRAYCDAGVLVAVAATERGWPAISAWLNEYDPGTIYSDFGFGEMVSAFGDRVCRKEMSADYALELIENSREYVSIWTAVDAITADIVEATAMLADFDLALRLPDALHVAIARRLGLTLNSIDIRQVCTARKLGVAAVNPLELDETRL